MGRVGCGGAGRALSLLLREVQQSVGDVFKGVVTCWEDFVNALCLTIRP